MFKLRTLFCLSSLIVESCSCYAFHLYIYIIITNYTADQLLVLRSHCVNIICLGMGPRSGKHIKQMGHDASKWITAPITPYNGTAGQNVRIGLINY